MAVMPARRCPLPPFPDTAHTQCTAPAPVSAGGKCEAYSAACDCATCKLGWTGPACDTCNAAAHFLADPTDATKCTCAAGWTGDNCDTCAPGFSGPECQPCTAPVNCATGGLNADLCTCNTCNIGWTGPACDTCDAGFTPNGDNTACIRDCTVAGCAVGGCPTNAGVCTTCSAGFSPNGDNTMVRGAAVPAPAPALPLSCADPGAHFISL